MKTTETVRETDIEKEAGKGKTFLYSVLLAAVLIAADQWTKHLAAVNLKGNEPFTLIRGILEFRYLENEGAAFSLLQGQQLFFYILTGVFIVICVYLLFRIPRTRYYLPVRICLLVLLSGAAGNLIDRVVQKYVVDFIYFSVIDFPIFNMADIYVTLSVIALALMIIFKYKDNDFSFLHKKTTEKENET